MQKMTPKDLTNVRTKARFTQRELADRLDVTMATISRWESGERAISLRDAVAYAKACGARVVVVSDETDELPALLDAQHPQDLALLHDLLVVLPDLDKAKREDLAALVAHWRHVKKM